jgi:hypothetical protein
MRRHSRTPAVRTSLPAGSAETARFSPASSSASRPLSSSSSGSLGPAWPDWADWSALPPSSERSSRTIAACCWRRKAAFCWRASVPETSAVICAAASSTDACLTSAAVARRRRALDVGAARYSTDRQTSGIEWNGRLTELVRVVDTERREQRVSGRQRVGRRKTLQRVCEALPGITPALLCRVAREAVQERGSGRAECLDDLSSGLARVLDILHSDRRQGVLGG